MSFDGKDLRETSILSYMQRSQGFFFILREDDEVKAIKQNCIGQYTILTTRKFAEALQSSIRS